MDIVKAYVRRSALIDKVKTGKQKLKLFMNKAKGSQKEKNTPNKEIEVDLIYALPKEDNFRLFQALNMLVSEEDIQDYLLSKKLCQQKKQ